MYISREVKVGGLMLGGNNPIRIQSMTNTNTSNTQATVAQAIRMIKAGCELVRITAPGIKEAENLAVIKRELLLLGYDVPLVADIHYNPLAAEIAAAIVEKVRINPGNYTGSKAATKTSYTQAEYDDELGNITRSLKPLIDICKQHGTALRIGVNHGSLGGRIIHRYGDTVNGMVVSALEYARICNNLDFQNLILSVKASNTMVMVNAYRDLAISLTNEGLNYPLHLGVTEAGNGDEGRMKSIAGIGAVLSLGIGDTIRVSLTEDPEAEIPVAINLVNRFTTRLPSGELSREPRIDLVTNTSETPCINDRKQNMGFPHKGSPVALLIKDENKILVAHENGDLNELMLPVLDVESFIHSEVQSQCFVLIKNTVDFDRRNRLIPLLDRNPQAALIVKLPASETSGFISILRGNKCMNPVILMSTQNATTLEEVLIENSLYPGSLLIDGIGEGLCIEANSLPLTSLVKLGFGILQATRARITGTEFIACPSCGRTRFNIQQRLEEVKTATSHLKGLKIAVMGCIVNGPGEMADADYGYVGAGNGLVNLYISKTLVMRSVPEDNAVEKLVELIKKNNDWQPTPE